MARFLAVVVASVLLATGGFAVDPDCFQYSGCSNCTEAPSGKCGWDPAGQRCAEGTESGPTDSADWSGVWWWTSTECCAANTRCGECVSNGFYCGWDVTQGRCLRGSSSGPAVGTSQSWVYPDSSACPSQCSDNADCFSCINNQMGCGWLDSVQRCVAGGASGAYAGQSNVSAALTPHDWYFSSCPPSWRLRWSANSYSLWCIVGGVAMFLLVTAATIRCLRKRILREEAAAQGLAGCPAALLDASNSQPDARHVYNLGLPAGIPDYGATPTPPPAARQYGVEVY